MSRKPSLPDVAAILLLLAGNFFIIAPFLRTDLFSDIWNNDYDYNYIGDARMFRDQPWTWNMLQYCGTPAKYIYPPLFHLLALVVPVPISRGKPVSIYGINFGSSGDQGRVWIGGRQASVVFHGPGLVNAVIPEDAPASASISVDVNGCRGNAFTIAVK